jgi:hypothetical protein
MGHDRKVITGRVLDSSAEPYLAAACVSQSCFDTPIAFNGWAINPIRQRVEQGAKNNWRKAALGRTRWHGPTGSYF